LTTYTMRLPQFDPTHGIVESMNSRLASVSGVIVVEDCALDADLMHCLALALSEVAIDSEIIIVANGLNDSNFPALKNLIAEIPDCSCYVIADTIDSDAARLFGMEAAVGDFVVLMNAIPAAIVAIPTAVRAMQGGFDIVIALPKILGEEYAKFNPLEWLAYKVLSLFTGLPINRAKSDLLILSREAALNILSKTNAELMLKAQTAGPGFPARTISDAYEALPTSDRRTIGRRAGKAVGLLISVGSGPIRLVNIITLTTSILSVLYAGFVILVYLLKPDPAAGWTTLSLQIAGMMFLFSVMLALMSEYIVQIYSATSGRRRRMVVRELRSEKTARPDRLNVVDVRGVYTLGAPRRPATNEPQA
jgi:hypothetical protein